MRSSNPALGKKFFENVGTSAGVDTMTQRGAYGKTAFLLLLCLGGATFSWTYNLGGLVIPALVVGLILAVAIMFKTHLAPYLAPVYAVVEGLALGAISLAYQTQYNGIVQNAIMLTFAVMAVMLFLYSTGIIRVNKTFMVVVVAATGAIFLVYITSFIMSFFGSSIPLIHSSGTFGIIFSLVVVGVAALNLVLDFNLIEEGEKRGLPKHMEWYGAFALLVTLVWLYLEMLRLLSKLNRR